MSSCCHHVHHVHETVIPSKCDCCSCCDELNLSKLKNTNHELKTLINKLDDLSVSVESSIMSHSAKNHHHNTNASFSRWPRCNICEEFEEVNVTRYEYDQVICKKCENMLRLSKLLDEEPKWKKVDPNIYPLDKYPHGSKYYRTRCVECSDDHQRKRSHSSRKSRSRPCDCMRSRSTSRRSHSSRGRSGSRSRARTPEIRPNWNGGPYTSSYLWRQWKLVDSKH
jgi:hypothetical protein